MPCKTEYGVGGRVPEGWEGWGGGGEGREKYCHQLLGKMLLNTLTRKSAPF